MRERHIISTLSYIEGHAVKSTKINFVNNDWEGTLKTHKLTNRERKKISFLRRTISNCFEIFIIFIYSRSELGHDHENFFMKMEINLHRICLKNKSRIM